MSRTTSLDIDGMSKSVENEFTPHYIHLNRYINYYLNKTI